MTRITGSMRFVALFGIAAGILLSAGLFVAAAAQAVTLLVEKLRHLGDTAASRELLIGSIEVTDSLLVATGLLIVSLGLFSLFIKRLDQLPAWLRIDSFDALKDKLSSVIVGALLVRFFSVVSDAREMANVLPSGLAIAVVLVGLAVHSLATARAHAGQRSEPPHAT